MESLERLHALAEDQAARHFGAAAAPPWQPGCRPAASARRAWLWASCAIVAGLAWGSWALAQNFAAPVPPTAPFAPPPQPAAAPVRAARPGHDARVLTITAAARAPAFRVESLGGVWHIHADSAARDEVAHELAALSGTELRSGVGALRAAHPLSLRWEGRDLAQAWQAVIGQEASYALQCGAGRCKAWIVEPAPAGHQASIAAPHFTMATPLAVHQTSVERSAYD